MGDGISAHSAVWVVMLSLEVSPIQELVLLVEKVGRLSNASSSGVRVCGLGDAEGTFVMIDSGGRMLNIWSSDCGGPYESKGSGTD